MEFHFDSVKTGERETIVLQLHASGWLVHFGPYGAITQPDGSFVNWILRRHSVQVLPALNDALEELWEAAHRHRLDGTQIQERLHAFSQWLKSFNEQQAASAVAEVPGNLRFGT